MMKITVCIANEQKIDIGVHKKQVIQETFSILQEKGICFLSPSPYIKVPRMNKQISVLSTYEDAGIMEGDMLHI